MAKVIYTVSVRIERKDGKPISKRSKVHKMCLELLKKAEVAGWEVRR
jgi:hypothetical protein